MKKIIILLSAACIALPVTAVPNNLPTPFGNTSRTFTTPDFNWGGNNNGFRNGSNWNMPTFNMGNGNRYGNRFGNGSNWSMPDFNWGSGNGFRNGSSMNMPNFNWGSGNNGFGNGSNWNMPKFNWNNNNNRYNPYGNGSNWSMPSFNMGSNNPPPPGVWRNNQNYNSYVQPNRGIPAPAMPKPPVFNNRAMQQTRPNMNPNMHKGMKRPAAPSVRSTAPSRIQMPMQKNLQKPMQMPKAKTQPVAPVTPQSKVAPTTYPPEINEANDVTAKIPTPSEVKGVILAPQNKPKATDTTASAKTEPNGTEKSFTQSLKDKLNDAVKKITD
jgi:hypothetical protein